MSITIYGYSDDLIEVEGDIREEFSYHDHVDDQGDLVAFSDGTVLRVLFDESGTWRITPVSRGSAQLTIEQVTEDSDAYTDRATLDGDIRWVVQGIAILTKGRANG